MNPGERSVFHIDMDSFYASVEMREHPEYLGKAVIIGADPKEGRGRGVVAACSYEARKFGVRSAMPISRAYQLCPHGIYLPPNFRLYDTVSDQIMEYLNSYTELFEQVSIDEAYMDVSNLVQAYNDPVELAGKIQNGIQEKFRLSCSIGIAHNKSIAKIASDYRKPAGITHVPYENFKEFLRPLSVGKISGIGPKTEQLLNRLGIDTISELADASKQLLKERIGKYGLYLWEIANGLESDSVLRGEWQMRSTSHEHTFSVDTKDFELIEKNVRKLTEHLLDKLKEKHLYYKTVTLKIRFQDFETFTRSKSLNLYSQSLDKALELSNELLREFRSSWRKVRLIGVKLSNLKGLDEDQSTLLRWE